MLVYLLRRLGQSLLVLLAVSFVAFLVFRYIGDPTLSLLGEDATLEERQALTEQLGLNQPVPLPPAARVARKSLSMLRSTSRATSPSTWAASVDTRLRPWWRKSAQRAPSSSKCSA